MKKICVSLLVALFVSVLAVSASAVSDAYLENRAEYERITEIVHEKTDGLDLTTENFADVMHQAYCEEFAKAGWTIISSEQTVAEEEAEAAAHIAPRTYELAYMDVNRSSPAMKEEILAAREEIIFNHSWYASSSIYYSGFNADFETKEITLVPKFEDLFPGWEIPKSNASTDLYDGWIDTPELSESPAVSDAYLENRAEYEKITEIVHEKTDGLDLTTENFADVMHQAYCEEFAKAGWTIISSEQTVAEEEAEAAAHIAPRTYELAYMDVNRSSPEMKEEILAARKEIIFNHSWYDDSDGSCYGGFDADFETRSITLVPKFSELFPGWENPKLGYGDGYDSTELDNSQTDTPELAESSAAAETASGITEVAAALWRAARQIG